jgi:hypothetical protein
MAQSGRLAAPMPAANAPSPAMTGAAPATRVVNRRDARHGPWPPGRTGAAARRLVTQDEKPAVASRRGLAHVSEDRVKYRGGYRD